jgi:hypothetical protein
LEEKYGLNRAGECQRDEREQTFRSRVVNTTMPSKSEANGTFEKSLPDIWLLGRRRPA